MKTLKFVLSEEVISNLVGDGIMWSYCKKKNYISIKRIENILHGENNPISLLHWQNHRKITCVYNVWKHMKITISNSCYRLWNGNEPYQYNALYWHVDGFKHVTCFPLWFYHFRKGVYFIYCILSIFIYFGGIFLLTVTSISYTMISFNHDT
jgi:hypothetical protein